MACIYKLTRSDGLEYIGITKNLRKRLNAHKNSRRFRDRSIVSCEVLFEGTYEECDLLEESYIEKHGTYKNGLNMTSKGKGKGKNEDCKFNTLGYKFSEESRKRMSESSKKRTYRARGYKHSTTTKSRWSEIRKGRVWGPVKIDSERLISEWNLFSPTLSDMEHMLSTKDGELYFKNGRKFSYTRGKLVLFKKMKCIEYNTTPEAIKRIITNAKLL